MQIRKLSIHADCFLFNCLESDTARMRKDGTFKSHLRFEPFLFKTYKPQKRYGLSSFKKELLKVIQHTFDVNPQFKRNEEINLETISWFTQAITTLFADINELCLVWTGKQLPNIFTEQVSIDKNYEVIKQVIEAYFAWEKEKSEEKAPFAFFNSEKIKVEEKELLLENVYSAQIWHLVNENIRTIFKEYFDAFSFYANWKYSSSESEDDLIVKIDWNVRPPVGSLFGKYIRSLQYREERNFKSHSHQGGFRDHKSAPFKKDFKDNKFKEPRQDREKPEFNHKRNEAKPEFSSTRNEAKPEFNPSRNDSKPPFRSEHNRTSGFKKENFNSAESKPRQHNHSSFPKQDPALQAKALDEAISEAKAAVSKMLKNPNLDLLPLSAVNSFLRREQHTIITDAGFETVSEGEGSSRHVCVKRKG